MPKIVDHEARRREVTAVAADLLARDGRPALTVRNVAASAGCSTTVVSHYFDDMAHLLFEIYDFAARRARERIDAVVARDSTDIEGLVEAVLPLDDQRRQDWRIWFAFWSEALASPELASSQRQRAEGNADRIRRCLRELESSGELRPGTDTSTAADRLSALIPGIAAEAIFDPTRWTPDHQRRILRSELETLGLARRAGASPARDQASGS